MTIETNLSPAEIVKRLGGEDAGDELIEFPALDGSGETWKLQRRSDSIHWHTWASGNEAAIAARLGQARHVVPDRNGKLAYVENEDSSDFAWFNVRTDEGPVLWGNWLIKNVLPVSGTGVIFGRPGCGKSLIVLDLLLHIAAGLPWRGIKTEKAEVVYLSSEAGRVGVNRVHAWLEHHGIGWPPGFHLTPTSLNLRSETKDVDRLINEIRVQAPRCQIFAVDTLARNFGGGNENAGEDMAPFIKNIEAVSDELLAFGLVVHHSGKDETKGARGSNSLLGAIDFEAEIKRDKGQPGTLTITKLRDGVDGAEYGFAVVSHHLGEDEDGDAVTAPIAVEADLDGTKKVTLEKLGKNQKAILKAMHQFIMDNGRPTPEGTGFPDPNYKLQCVSFEAFLEFVAGKMTAPSERKKQKAAREGIDGLIARGMICINEGMIWRP